MFAEVAIRASGLAASARFYETVLAALDCPPAGRGDDHVRWADFAVRGADDRHPVTRRLHVGFFAATTAAVDAFWQAGTAAGHPSDGAPGPRPRYGPDYYGGFLLDPDGNSVEAVNLDGAREQGRIDHVWIRVRDVAASRRFYAAIAPRAGFDLDAHEPELARFRGPGCSFTLVAGEPTRQVGIALAGNPSGPPARDPDGNLVTVVG